MTPAEEERRTCPFCKESIRPDAIKCKHCGAPVPPEAPLHEGTCPYCREEIHPEAIRCKHCRSNLESGVGTGCGCRGGGAGAPAAFRRAGALDLGDLLGPFDCVGEYVKCRRELSRLGVPAEDAMRWCGFGYWGCTVRQGMFDRLFV